MNIKKSTVVRTILLIVAIVNRFLTSKGITFIVDETLAGLLADLFLAVVSLVCFWYNNSFTKNAIKADKYLDELRNTKNPSDFDDILSLF